MTSKEALEEIRDFRYGENKLLVCQTEMYDIIKQDLDRLEELEKENQKLKETCNKQGKMKRKLKDYINFLENELKKKNLM